jgi:hypothetical protein
MGRTAKYATLKTYQPFIDAIRKDLKIPDTMIIDLRFADLRGRRSGDATTHSKTYSKVRVSKHLSHNEILRVLMHELRHVWQYTSGTMESKVEKIKRGYSYKKVWNNTVYDDYGMKTRTHYNKYYTSPWEVDARAYADKLFTLFPGGKVKAVQSRKLVGVVGGVKFYKIAS